jgi:hypothetical protein
MTQYRYGVTMSQSKLLIDSGVRLLHLKRGRFPYFRQSVIIKVN